MNKIRMLFICLFCVATFSMSLYAQNSNYNISGILQEEKSIEPVPYVTIQTYTVSDNKQAVYACVSDLQGRFNIPIKQQGDYRIVFSYVGKQTRVINISLEKEFKIDLGTIKLADQNTELNTVNVYAQKPLIKLSPDKISYQVSEDPESANAPLLTIAEKVPLLTIDPEIGVLLNNCTPLILIDGRKLRYINSNPLNYLRKTAASGISKIELITAPGAKYDAEENCGVINIITRKNNDTSLMIGSQIDSNFGSEIFTDIGFSYNKFTVNANADFSSTRKFDSEESSIRYNKNDINSYKLTQQGGTRLNGNDISKSITLDMSYQFDSVNTLSFSSDYYLDRVKDSTYQTNTMSDIDGNQKYIYSYNEKSKLNWGNYELGLYYEYHPTNGKNTFNISGMKSVEFVDQNNDQEITPILNYSSSYYQYDQNEKLDESTLQIDYVHAFSSQSSYSGGFKTIWRDNNSTSDQYTAGSDINLGNGSFENMQKILSVYSELAFQLGSKLNIVPGFRYETTYINGGYIDNSTADFSSRYANPLPYLSISTKTTRGILWTLDYSSKIQRPGIVALNPSIYVIDNQNIYYGNPSLKSEYRNITSLSYSNYRTDIKQYAKLSYTFSNNSIQNISGIDNDVYYTTYTNNGQYRNLNLDLNLNSQITKWFMARVSGNIAYIMLKQQETSNSGWTGLMNMSSQFKLTDDYKLKLTGMYRFPQISLQGRGYNFYSYNISVSKSFFNDKLYMQLACKDPYQKTKRYSRTMNNKDFYITTDKFNMGRELWFEVYYTINDKDIKAKQTGKSISNEDLVGSSASQ